MRKRHVVEEVDDTGRKRTEIYDEDSPDHTPEDDGAGDLHSERSHEDVVDTETVEAEPNAWDVARGWVRTLVVWAALALVIVETLLAFRLGFLLGNANENNGFVDFIYDTSGPLAEPFEGIASPSAVNGGVFDYATFIAMVVYLVAAILFMLLVWAVTAGPSLGERRISTRSHHSLRGDVHGR